MGLGKLLLTRQHEPEAAKALKEGRVSFIDKRDLVGVGYQALIVP